MMIEITNIHYDVEDSEGYIDLPNSITLEVDLNDFTDQDQLIAYISDEISNQTGFCHKGFAYQSI